VLEVLEDWSKFFGIVFDMLNFVAEPLLMDTIVGWKPSPRPII